MLSSGLFCSAGILRCGGVGSRTIFNSSRIALNSPRALSSLGAATYAPTKIVKATSDNGAENAPLGFVIGNGLASRGVLKVSGPYLVAPQLAASPPRHFSTSSAKEGSGAGGGSGAGEGKGGYVPNEPLERKKTGVKFFVVGGVIWMAHYLVHPRLVRGLGKMSQDTFKMITMAVGTISIVIGVALLFI